jgi:hypothetical protein
LRQLDDVLDPGAPRRHHERDLLGFCPLRGVRQETYRLSFMEDPKFTEEMFRSAPLEREGGPGWQAFDAVMKALRELKESGKVARTEDENLLAEVLWTGARRGQPQTDLSRFPDQLHRSFGQ